ncbi:hypothetical protein [Streptomyces hundungensis]|uniref:hypothetical protein n=1 Tax=Streptomyces hundungensis TaxID=1077946 RepID=UPI0013C512FE|nr:hypothetical protein [Streptomyces hundungensis]
MAALLATGGTIAAAGAGDNEARDRRQVQPSRASSAEPLREATEGEQDLLHSAEQLLLRDCMKDKGFVYVPVPRQPVREARQFPYVVDDTSWAHRHGYGSDLDRASEKLRTNDANERYFQSLPQERRGPAIVAANGPRPDGLTARTPDGMAITHSAQGCESQAQRSLYRDLPAWFQARVTMDSLPALRGAKVIADSEFLSGTHRWSACMRTAGYAFKDPAAARAALPPSDHPLPQAREVAMAVAEADCAQSSGLAAAAARLDQKYDAELRKQYWGEVSTWLRLRLSALPRARSVVAADAHR